MSNSDPKEPKTKECLYKTLNLHRSSNPELWIIKSAYRSASIQYHPDNGSKPDAEKFAAVAFAYSILSDPEKKRFYDETGSTDQDAIKNTALEQIAKKIHPAHQRRNHRGGFLHPRSYSPLRTILADFRLEVEQLKKGIEEANHLGDHFQLHLGVFFRDTPSELVEHPVYGLVESKLREAIEVTIKQVDHHKKNLLIKEEAVKLLEQIASSAWQQSHKALPPPSNTELITDVQSPDEKDSEEKS